MGKIPFLSIYLINFKKQIYYQKSNKNMKKINLLGKKIIRNNTNYLTIFYAFFNNYSIKVKIYFLILYIPQNYN